MNVNALPVNIVYYRLKQVDFNGNYTYSEIRSIYLHHNATQFNAKAWYNSSDDRMYVNISDSKAEDATVQLYDVEGKLIASQGISTQNGVTQLSISAAGLSKGIYMCTITTGNQAVKQKVMKY